jgi:TIR domain-containing protein
MSKIFISYRRTDSADITGRMFDRLTRRFARDALFKDVDSIPLGIDFRKSISDAVQSCDVVLAVIGRNWLYAKDNQGNHRLSDPDDFVRIELEAGLARDIPVIPVLVGGADMPAMEALPHSLQPLVYRNAISVRPDPDFNADIRRLITALAEILQRKNVIKRKLIAFNFGVFKSKLLSRFIMYTAIAMLLFVVFIGGYLGYLRFFRHNQSVDLDECATPNPPISCLFK